MIFYDICSVPGSGNVLDEQLPVSCAQCVRVGRAPLFAWSPAGGQGSGVRGGTEPAEHLRAEAFDLKTSAQRRLRGRDQPQVLGRAGEPGKKIGHPLEALGVRTVVRRSRE